MTLAFESLNHAAMLIDLGEIKLLTDPWLEGTAFSGGWGLAYDNPDALRVAASATHMWISHWHSDHFHAPTLEKLAAARPDLCVLANVSANFSTVERVRTLGFRNVVPLAERERLALSGAVSVVRYPTAGIDNMLHIATREGSILNYNDCNLPAGALERFRQRIGKIDVLLSNYNHAGKLFVAASEATIKAQYWSALLRVVNSIAPRLVVPFASSHYYRSAWSSDQNGSLLTFDELEQRVAGDARFAILRPGDRVQLGAGGLVSRKLPACPLNPRTPNDYGAGIAWEELCRIADERCTELGKSFAPLGMLAQPLRVLLQDLNQVLELRIGKPCRQSAEGADIVTHSRALYDWLGRRFGDDTFFAGAHFALCHDDSRALRTWALFTLLEGSHLDPRSLLGYVANSNGRRFLWNRSEEAWATLVSLQLKGGQPRI